MSEQPAGIDVALRDRAQEIGTGTRVALDPPSESDFGTFHAATVFETGCKPTDVIAGNGVVLFRTSNSIGSSGAITREVSIGRTPDIHNPAKEGGELLAEAGAVGEYLMYTKTSVKEGEQPATTTDVYAYLDEDNLADVVVRKGDKFTLLQATETRQNVSVQGRVEEVMALN